MSTIQESKSSQSRTRNRFGQWLQQRGSWLLLSIVALMLLVVLFNDGSRRFWEKPETAATSTEGESTEGSAPLAGLGVTRTTKTFEFSPDADAFVTAENNQESKGKTATLRLDGDPEVRTYIRFEVYGIQEFVERATLQIYANSSSTVGFQIQRVPANDWHEQAITFLNAPPTGDLIGVSGGFEADSWVSIDLTSIVKGEGVYSLALVTTGNTNISLASRESGTFAPMLIVQTSDVPALSTETSSGQGFDLLTRQLPVDTLPLTFELLPIADTYVDSISPEENKGKQARLRADSEPKAQAYLRFDVGELSGDLQKATLHVFADSGADAGIQTYLVNSTTWGENNLTFVNAPTFSRLLDHSPAFSANSWVLLDVTDVVQANQSVSLAIVSPEDTNVTIHSREAESHVPRLIIETSVPRVGGITMFAAGDIAGCRSQGDEATANLIDQTAGYFLALGDVVYDYGTTDEFNDCYHLSWGRHLGRTLPAVGNHEYRTEGAEPYYNYFGNLAGDPSQGYYSVDIGDWHIITLNSNCSKVGGCQAGKPQYQWLQADLVASSAKCTMAIWHHPRWSSGEHGNFESMDAMWQLLYMEGVELVLNGHDHVYERFEPMDFAGNLDVERGIRSFIVGTGGKSLDSFAEVKPNSAVRYSNDFGLLQLTLHPDSYDWEFVPAEETDFTDAGKDTCH